MSSDLTSSVNSINSFIGVFVAEGRDIFLRITREPECILYSPDQSPAFTEILECGFGAVRCAAQNLKILTPDLNIISVFLKLQNVEQSPEFGGHNFMDFFGVMSPRSSYRQGS